jgi:hypothetical protein
VNEYIGLLDSFYKGPKKVMLVLQFLKLCNIVVSQFHLLTDRQKKYVVECIIIAVLLVLVLSLN